MASNKWSYADGGSFDPTTTRYVQLRSATGPYYDRQTGKIGTFPSTSNGAFSPYGNQTSSLQTYAPEVAGVRSAGPIGSAPQTPQQAAQAIQQTSAEPSDQSYFPDENITLVIPPPQITNTALRYPSEPATTENSDYVVFSFYEYAPPFGGSYGGNRATAGSTTTQTNQTWGYANYQNSNDRSYAKKSTKVRSIILYMPEDIQTQFGAGWNGAGFGASAAGMLGLAGSLNTQKDFGALLQAGVSSFGGVLKTATFSAITEAINKAAGANISLNQALGSVTGTIINPNVELLYEAPKLRTFNLKFKLVPRTKKEADDIRAICNTFKKAMLPNFGGQALFGAQKEAANILTIPDLCQVSFMTGNKVHTYLPKYKLCGITDVNINYTADGAYSTVGTDGSPTATELTISFLESKLVFSEEVKEDGTGI